MKKLLLGLMMSLTLLSANIWQDGYVVKVEDGDTIHIRDKDFNVFKSRLIGIDTYETKENDRAYLQLKQLQDLHYKSNKSIHDVYILGFEAKGYTLKKALFKNVEYKEYGLDKYGRKLVYVSGLNYMLIRLGLAVYYPNNKLPQRLKSFLLEASKEANLEQRGIYQKGK